MRRSLVQARDTIVQPYYNLIMSWPVWRYVTNAEPARLFADNPPKLPPEAARVASELKARGVALTSLDALFPGENLLPKLQAYAAELRPYAEQVTNKKPFILEHWEATPAMSLKNPFVELSLRPTVLGIINSYMGMWSKFYYFMLGLAIPRGEAPRASQRWHRDFEEIRMCKMFVYLNDVGEKNGPFIYVPESNLGGKWRSVYPPIAGHGRYPADGEVEARIPRGAIMRCMGKAGTVIFADTTGLHKGGYVEEGERLMYTAGYNSRAAMGRKRYRLAKDEASERAALPPEARYSFRALPDA